MAIALFESGMNPNRSNWMGITQLHHFAAKGDIDRAELFLDHGADIEAREDESKSRPLAWAARRGREAMVELLLQRGARPRLPDDPEWATPLAWATRRGHAGVVRMLARG
jgi:ankyrin repeat protein